ncbi:hypothetical protein V8F20_004809 [Naviculisporaceae sp. PSN 640]
MDQRNHRYYREAAPGPPSRDDSYRRWTAINDNQSYRPDYRHDDRNGYRRDDRHDDHYYSRDNHRTDYARDREYQFDFTTTAGRAYDPDHGFAPGVDPERYLRPPPPPTTLPPPPPPSDPAQGGDSYRPKLSFNLPRSDFGFRVKAPTAIEEELDRHSQDQPAFQGYSHEAARQERHRRREARREGTETLNQQQDLLKLRKNERKRQDREERKRRERKGPKPSAPNWPVRRPKPLLADRELLTGAHADTAESFYDESAGATYRNLSDISDSDEEDMDISDSGSGSDPDAKEPHHKRARKGLEPATGAEVPKWSNPDPYTACPPETSQQTKKKDVVQLIRKARIQAKEVKTSLPEEAQDFISLGLDSSDESESDSQPGPTSGARDLEQTADNISNAFAAQFGRPLVDEPRTLIKRSGPTPAVVDGPFPPQPAPDRTGELGSRKRFHDDRIKGPSHPSTKRGPKDGTVTADWARRPGVDASPWFDKNGWQPNGRIALHQEIVDFYNYVRPRQFEHDIRQGLVKDLANFVRQRYRDAEVYPFGSFASDLYLPTGDMDLAFLSDSYYEGYQAKYNSKKQLFKLKEQLANARIAARGDIETVLGAKVPIVKYTDLKTGLKVDISFENTTGIDAIKTFKHWKQEYPSMPVLVTLIKQFLAMRGLNEPFNGGIGGFSVICLVVSMLQQEPSFQTKSRDDKHYLADMLMHFFNLYGRVFNYEDLAISLNPPRYIKKHLVREFTYKKFDRLSIIDPNNPANDIAGGSANFHTIRRQFHQAYLDLGARMADLEANPNQEPSSILEWIVGGNYTSFIAQRNRMQRIHDGAQKA